MGHLPDSSASITRAWLASGTLLALSFVMIATLTLSPQQNSGAVAVIFPPWWSTQQSLLAAASAGASIVRTSSIPAIVIVEPGRHDGLRRLRDAGVWLSLDPQALEACMSISPYPKAEGLRA